MVDTAKFVVGYIVVAMGLVGCSLLNEKPAEIDIVVPAVLSDPDSDRDGVALTKDQCPDTPLGMKVDFKGCEILFELTGINFGFASSELTAEGRDVLLGLVNELSRSSTKRIEIAGHTDSLGSDDYNRILSEQRARSVADFLEANGIDPARVVVRGYGEDYPAIDNKTLVGRRANRRVEVIDLGSQ